MSKAPAMPLFVDAYMADTMHLSEAEDGVYMRLLMCMWRMEGRLPDDDVLLARFARVSKNKWIKNYRPVLINFFTISDGFLTQKRLKKVWLHVAKKTNKNQQNGAMGGRPKSLKNKETTKANGFVSDNPNDNPRRTQTKSIQNQNQKEEKKGAIAPQKKTPAKTPPDDNPDKPDLLKIPDFLDRRKKPKRGTRIADDWTLPDDWKAWAVAEGLAEPEREADRFHDYWLARPGAAAVKLDWAATWRNWVRRAGENSRNTIAEAFASQRRAVMGGSS